ncbi:sensor histidine kinase [Nonomuraea diastatica]|uniref:histidine kinase n=1 Tax=Nonomuraea diastatica TaxID=1848329 RepID=A0A4R4WXQ1_9ACTN|nr:histidine kinase [Nonomuraea diastatica]TDD22609.1 sensor histidine kinase [Nonomuraea diastatica]
MGIRPAFGGPARQAVNALAGYARNGVSSLAALALNAVTGLAALVVLALVLVSAALVPVAGFGRAPLGLGLALVHRLAAYQRRWAGRVLDRDGAAGSHRCETDRPLRATAVPEPRRRGTLRELGWLAVHVVTGPVPVVAVWAMLAALDYVWFRLRPAETSTLNTFALSFSIVAIAAVALMAMPLFRIGQARLTRRLLDGGTATDARIRSLTASRAAVVDARAAELRRIERDLHDGAQAKLIAVRMHLGLARGSRDPGEMVRMIDEAREVAGQALTDLRDLVRGMHPPVLSDRGLAGAIEASALLCPIPVEVDIDLPGRPQPPVESAVYFAVAEALVNVAKHSGASRAWVRLRHTAGVLRMTVGDNGCGMVRCDGGTGVRGIEDRLSAFDGSLTVSSPQGGPTVLTMEVPCALS